MSTVADLMGLGMPGALASRLGFTPTTLTTTGTSATTAAAIQTKLTILTTASSQTGAILPAAASLGGIFIVTNPTATTGIVYPDSGGTINGGTATTGGQNIAQNKTIIFIKVANLTWVSVLTA